MDRKHRSGSRELRIPRAHAGTISNALVEQARREVDWLSTELTAELGAVETYPLRSQDAASASSHLVKTLTALDAVGWPHAHAESRS